MVTSDPNNAAIALNLSNTKGNTTEAIETKPKSPAISDIFSSCLSFNLRIEKYINPAYLSILPLQIKSKFANVKICQTE